MPYYYAQFLQNGKHTFRLDTRIYLEDTKSPGAQDKYVAAIVAKNPGSAVANGAYGSLAPLSLGGDNLLPSVRNRFIDAYKAAGKCIPPGAFVRVWNLFYLCDPRLANALKSYQSISSPPQCSTECQVPPIVWYAWGGNDKHLNPLKNRFLNYSKPSAAFFYDRKTKRVVLQVPKAGDFAKHPQGLSAKPIVDFLATVV